MSCSQRFSCSKKSNTPVNFTAVCTTSPVHVHGTPMVVLNPRGRG